MQDDPINVVEWIDRESLSPNDYNPNRQAPPEHELLVLSILESGWTSAIVVLPDYTIVDGYHRWLASADKRLAKKYRGKVPIVILNADPVHRRMATVRHNRARGQHGILPMADLVRGMVEDGVPREAIERGLGMEDEELDRLLARAGMPTKIGSGFGKSWRPGDK